MGGFSCRGWPHVWLHNPPSDKSVRYAILARCFYWPRFVLIFLMCAILESTWIYRGVAAGSWPPSLSWPTSSASWGQSPWFSQGALSWTLLHILNQICLPGSKWILPVAFFSSLSSFRFESDELDMLEYWWGQLCRCRSQSWHLCAYISFVVWQSIPPSNTYRCFRSSVM